jgi:hypothetical protein
MESQKKHVPNHQPGTVYIGCGILDYPIYYGKKNHVPNHQPA